MARLVLLVLIVATVILLWKAFGPKTWANRNTQPRQTMPPRGPDDDEEFLWNLKKERFKQRREAERRQQEETGQERAGSGEAGQKRTGTDETGAAGPTPGTEDPRPTDGIEGHERPDEGTDGSLGPSGPSGPSR
ncbi:hypothetical protein [Corynebacterium heidelbergense]|uniref:hypothetical protein n=1 Tax=Corynebacterium heidelbergense TaxID=2055947 RepID=UPI0015EED242|nr:hypothetical protein [Corynebacterium heidelbergense]WCZ37376.1 hypothetical protein CHEID_09250 [Corynebacterium heidelbergense]